ncbi:Eukaryotic translation initiation factor 3 subunit 10 [hydrothermal vent metagenome]|uniref:Eukaryotic translation initiation factor 3 subunit 10 n=1 Tax=hydrothermal vent metagenome TaxID=652676 RepID=A0A3B0S500_9ZZZZ
MRSSKSRSRNKSNRNRSSGGNVMNRVFDSSGPESKVRGTPQQIIEKYNQLARDAHLSGDRVAAENFQQHAEHYLRLSGVAQKEMDAKREVQERENRERQADRDKDRDKDRERSQERVRRQERESNGGGDPAQAPQPDVMDASGNDSGLVVTPENRPPAQQPASPQPALTQPASPQPASPRPKRSRKPRVDPAVQNDAGAVPGETANDGKPDAPEAAE